MIKTADRTEKFAFAAVKRCAAIDAKIPIMPVCFDIQLYNLFREKGLYRCNFMPVLFHGATNLRKGKIECKVFLSLFLNIAVIFRQLFHPLF